MSSLHAVRLTSISEAEILGDGGGNAKSDNISSGRRIYSMSIHTLTDTIHWDTV